MQPDHVLINMATSRMECTRCGGWREIPLPMLSSELVKLLRRWEAQHRDCEEGTDAA